MPPARPPRACLALRRSARASAHAKQPPVGGGCWGKGGGALPHPHPAPGVHAAGAVSTRAVCTVTAASQTNRPLPPPLLVVHLPASLAPSSPPRPPSPACDESAVLLCVRYTTLIDSRYLVPIWRASQWDHRCDERVHCSRSAPPPPALPLPLGNAGHSAASLRKRGAPCPSRPRKRPRTRRLEKPLSATCCLARLGIPHPLVHGYRYGARGGGRVCPLVCVLCVLFARCVLWRSVCASLCSFVASSSLGRACAHRPRPDHNGVLDGYGGHPRQPTSPGTLTHLCYPGRDCLVL